METKGRTEGRRVVETIVENEEIGNRYEIDAMRRSREHTLLRRNRCTFGGVHTNSRANRVEQIGVLTGCSGVSHYPTVQRKRIGAPQDPRHL